MEFGTGRLRSMENRGKVTETKETEKAAESIPRLIRTLLTGWKNSYLSSTQEFFEIGVEGNQVLAQLNNHRRQPRIRNNIGSLFLLYAKLAKKGPLSTDSGHLDTRDGK